MGQNYSQHPTADALTGAEFIPIWQDGQARKVLRSVFIAGLGGGGGSYTLPNASASVLGGVKVGSGLAIDVDGILSATYSYSLPTASAGVVGGVRVGSGLSIDGAGILSANAYTLPAATTGALGGVRVGAGLAIDGSGILSAQSAIVAESGTTRTATPAHANNYTRFTNSATKTYTIDAAQGYAVGTEFHGRNMGAGNLTLAGAGGMTLNAPAGGTLAVPTNGTFSIKIVSGTEADVIGVTVAP